MTFLSVVQRPNATTQTGSATNTVVGAATMDAALSDSSDSSYVFIDARASLDTQVARVSIAAPVLASNTRVYSVGVQVRVQSVLVDPNNQPPLLLGWLRTNSGAITVSGQTTQVNKTAFYTYAPADSTGGVWSTIDLGQFTSAPDGTPWDATPTTGNLANLSVDLGRGDDLAANLQVAALYITVNYQQQATLTLTAPTSPSSATQATVKWTYASANFAPQTAYRVAVYTQAQTAAGGFAPFVSPPQFVTGLAGSSVATSWWQLGAASQWTTPGDLTDGIYVAYCVDMETEILTTDGWKNFDKVSVGDIALTLNHETGLSEWQPISRVNYFPPVKRKMLQIEGKNFSSLTTAQHRWPVIGSRGKRVWKTSESLALMDQVTLAAPCSCLPSLPKYQDSLVELVAWTWTEGYLLRGNPSGNPAGLTITQSHAVNADHCAAIRRALTDLFGPAFDGDMRSLKPINQERDRINQRRVARGPRPAWRERVDAKVGRTVFHLNSAAAEPIRSVMDDRKRVAPEFINELTHAQLKLFVDRSIDADGHRGTGTTVLVQKDVECVRRFEMACALAGIPTNTYVRQFDGCYQVVLKRAAQTAPMMRARKSQNFSAEWVEHDDAVWCPTLPNGSWLARRRGTVYYTGNSQAISQWPGAGGDFTTAISSITWTRTASPAGPPATAVLNSAAYSFTDMRTYITMTPGGTTPATVAFSVIKSTDGVTWSFAAPSLTYIPANGMSSVTVADRFPLLNQPTQYKVIAYSGSPLVAAAAPSSPITVTPVDNRYLVHHPTNPLLDTQIFIQSPKGDDGVKVTKRRMQGTYYFTGGPVTRAVPMMTWGPTYGREWALTLWFDMTANPGLWAAVDALDEASCPLYFQLPTGEAGWIGMGPGAAGQDTEDTFQIVPGNTSKYRWKRRKVIFTETQPPVYF